jgi:hypothetical protein
VNFGKDVPMVSPSKRYFLIKTTVHRSLTDSVSVHKLRTVADIESDKQNTFWRYNPMEPLDEKKIRAYHAKAETFICPACATDEEKRGDIIAEDEVHNEESMFCLRCKKKI